MEVILSEVDRTIKEGEDIYAYKNTLVCRDKEGKCWALSPRDYQGILPLEKLESVGKFEVVS